MKSLFVGRLGVILVGSLLAATGYSQMPGDAPMDGRGGGMIMRGNRPPLEQAFGGPGLQGRWWDNQQIIDKLKLTDDQRKQFDRILQEHREQLIDLRANLEKTELALEPLVRDDQPNESSILAQIDKVAQARAELEKANARYLLALRSKLTPDQWKQVQEFRRNRGPMHEMWRQRMERRQVVPGPGGPGGDGPVTAPAPPPGPQGLDDVGPAIALPAPHDAPGPGDVQ